MAQLPVWPTVRSAVEDVLANKPLAARIYTVYLVALIIENLPLLVLPSTSPLLLLGGVVSIAVWVYMMVNWAGWAVLRATGFSLPGALYGPTLIALLKNVVVLVLACIGDTMLFVFAAVLARGAMALGLAMGLAGFAAVAATLWVSIRISLVPARAAVGEGTSLGDGWTATKTATGQLLAIDLWLFLFMLAGVAVFYVIFAALSAVAIEWRWIAGPASMTAAAVAQWSDSVGARVVFVVTEFVVSPLLGLVRFTILGATIRAALFLRSSVAVVPDNPWAA